MYTEKSIATYNNKHDVGLHKAGIDRIVLVNNWDGYDRIFVVKNLYNITPDTTIEEALNQGNFSEIAGTDPTLSHVVQETERFIINATDITNSYIKLSFVPLTTRHISLFWNGVFMDFNTDGDVTLSVDRINFNLDMVPLLEVGDKIIVQYEH